MNLQEKHDSLVQKLQNLKLSKKQRILLASQQRKLAVELYVRKNGIKIIPMQKDKYRKNYTERIHVNTSFDNSSKTGLLKELKRIQADRITQKLGKVSF